MNSTNPTKALVETALLSSITSILAIAGMYIPFLGYLMLIVAVPFILIVVRHSARYGVLGALATGMLVMFVSFPTYGIYVAAMGGGVGILMGQQIKKRKESMTVIFYGALGASVTMILLLTLTTLVTGVSLIAMVEELLAESFQITDRMGLENVLLESGVTLEDILEIFKLILPSTLILTSAFFAVFNYNVGRVILRRTGFTAGESKPFSQFTLPGNIIMGTTLILILTYLSGYFNIVDTEVLFINILNLFIYIFLLQGLAIIFFLLEKKQFKTGMKIFVVLMVFLLQMVVGVALIGWIDNIFDFRKIRQKKTGV
ncbi:MAG: hypothetical protein AVO33_03250 [delta proteobacterium ML8_F1]|nr:MAG: hypothetical protein AVO33_03250 [delta proteobacterium ML8_F1]